LIDHYVIDTSVLAQGFIEDTETLRMDTLMHIVTDENNAVLHVPDFTLVECTNVIWKRVQFHGETPENARKILNDFRAFPLKIHTAAKLLSRAMDIAMSTRLAVYDCVHIALCENTGYPLITVDAKQTKAASAVGVQLKPITDFPEFVESEE
jgi:predicted nucleic acid-binding protein